MHRTRTILAIILVATGLVWIGQGTGILQGRSFMVGDPLWTVIGAACLVVGLAIGVAEVRRRRP
jgi:FtsH-binding integral membrane protein